MEFEATAELLQRAQQGEMQATNELFRRYHPRLVHIVAMRLGQRLGSIRAEVEDIVQDALLDAFRGLREFEPRSEGALLYWLAELAMNRYRDRWRREHAQKRAGDSGRELGGHDQQLLSSSILQGGVTTPSERLQGIELEQRLEQCLLALPEIDRRLIPGGLESGNALAGGDSDTGPSTIGLGYDAHPENGGPNDRGLPGMRATGFPSHCVGSVGPLLHITVWTECRRVSRHRSI